VFTARYGLDFLIIQMNSVIEVFTQRSINYKYCSTVRLLGSVSRRMAPGFNRQHSETCFMHEAERTIAGGQETKRRSPDLQRAPQLPTTKAFYSLRNKHVTAVLLTALYRPVAVCATPNSTQRVHRRLMPLGLFNKNTKF
jgi:hypothetical protein